ncbi:MULTISPECIES: MBL fold metallo-hydrolase [Enterococcaceae]|uniref:YtnP family quorum-quenching lactonase n=1 Tax=Enterococcaceae TaxID=81852 RepID=UPI000E4B9EC7|nr:MULTISPECIES: MBL fold metallo-hydrolase [Enterococcaceae]MCI0130747.1 MBL fold metallo-hydrolase [Vagococcus sp. CY53-2]RGI30138.1 MBL fold metallo-hydrolase [Melissococcus sp. OM08-11BH]UNM89137.1 MBL fold metallo-hydrolase [Vagococcus sp. CY52-2]
MDTLTFHDMTLTWLEGGMTCLDGGAMFGVVPKPVWTRKYPVNEKNQIELPTDPILIQYQGKNYLIDAGVGNGKFTDKQKKIFGVAWESEVESSLKELGLTFEDIDFLLMTHMHFDHATGLTKPTDDGGYVSVFPNAKIYVQAIEWEEMQHPNIRSKSTYWAYNWEPIVDQVVTYDKSIEVAEGLTIIHTGGHSNGHAVIKFEQQGETMIHMADIMPTHAHQNPLWVLAYDDYPMTSIANKEKLLKEAYENNYKFIFYHDAFYRMIQWDNEGKEMIDTLERSRERIIR